MKNLFKKIDKYLETHCLIFWHDFKETGKPVPGILGREQWYWTHEKCTKCPAERAVANG